MPRYSLYLRERIVLLSKVYKPSEIVALMKEEGFKTSERGIQYLLKKYRQTGSFYDAHRSGRPPVLNLEARKLMDWLLTENDELTTSELQDELLNHGYPASKSTVALTRQSMGWTSKATRYCQLIRTANKIKRVEFCKDLLDSGETFDNVLFTDESMVVMTPNVRRSYHKKGQPRRYKPKPKYPIRVLIWGGISKKGATKAIIFTGIMDAEKYVEILQRGLLPFMTKHFPDENMRFQQDNDPKHTSRVARAFFEANQVNWWRTPPESPDLNPQERVWSHLKQFLSSVVKPHNKTELIDGIKRFWNEKLTRQQCQRYINHIHKVIPKVIEKNGEAVVDDDI